jgi:hypothetical protein
MDSPCRVARPPADAREIEHGLPRFGRIGEELDDPLKEVNRGFGVSATVRCAGGIAKLVHGGLGHLGRHATFSL